MCTAQMIMAWISVSAYPSSPSVKRKRPPSLPSLPSGIGHFTHIRGAPQGISSLQLPKVLAPPWPFSIQSILHQFKTSLWELCGHGRQRQLCNRSYESRVSLVKSELWSNGNFLDHWLFKKTHTHGCGTQPVLVSWPSIGLPGYLGWLHYSSFPCGFLVQRNVTLRRYYDSVVKWWWCLVF